MEYFETSCELYKTSDQINLNIRKWVPDTETKAVFLAIHGGMAHAGDWCTPALYFKEKKIATYAPDLRWHGTFDKNNKNGKIFFHIDSYDQYVKDIYEIYEYIKKENPGKPVFIISHSNGALISLYFGLTLGFEADIKGYVLSSPWLKNKVEVPKVMISLSKLISKILPKFEVSPKPLTDLLTHDEKITKRHYEDESKGLRGTTVSAKLGVESMKTQSWVLNNIKDWDKFPVCAFIAGKDYLADPDVSEDALNSIPENLLTLYRYQENYHENFNEVNRDEIFEKIYNWISEQV